MTIFEQLNNSYRRPIYDWPQWMRIIIVMSFSGIIFLAEYFLLLPNVFEAYQTNLHREAELVNQSIQVWSELVNVKTLERQIVALKKSVHERLTYLPSRNERSPFLRYLSAHKTNLKLRYYYPDPLTHHKFYSEQLIRISLIGSYQELIDFLISMNQPRNQMMMKDIKLSLSKNGSKDQVVLMLNINAYIHYRD